MAVSAKSEERTIRRNGRTGARRLTSAELGGLLHGILFAYEKVFVNLYGSNGRRLYQYIMEELAPILRSKEDPIIDTSKSLEENIDNMIYFLTNEEHLKNISFEDKGRGKYVFEIGSCAFARSGVHEVLKVKEGICPFALVIGSCLSELNQGARVNITGSEFEDEGSRTYLEVISPESGEGGMATMLDLDDEILGVATSKVPLDELDMKLIRALRMNGRQSNVELSKSLEASESTIRRRIDDLVARGVIRGFTAVLRYSPKDTMLRIFIGLKVDPKQMDAIASRLSGMTESCSVYKTFGDFNLICEAIFVDRARFQEFIDELQYTEGVTQLTYSIGSVAAKPCPWFGF